MKSATVASDTPPVGTRHEAGAGQHAGARGLRVENSTRADEYLILIPANQIADDFHRTRHGHRHLNHVDPTRANGFGDRKRLLGR